jgi:hypothetical protein
MSREDITQEALLGLLEAARRFDPDRGVKFTTYCYPWIMKFVLGFVERNISRGLKPDKKTVERFLYQRMGEDESEDFVSTFVTCLSLDSSTKMGDGDYGLMDDTIGVCDSYDLLESDWVQYVAGVAAMILVADERVVYLEVLACIIEGSQSPVVDAAKNMRMRAENVRECFARASGRVEARIRADDQCHC